MDFRWASWLSTSATRAGTSVSALVSSASRFASMCPRARAAATARQAGTVNWVVKALVEATPISGPATVGSTRSDSRPMVLSTLLRRSEEHTSELQSLMRISYAVFCLKKKKTNNDSHNRQDNKTHTDKNQKPFNNY